jgi:GNAT superfamily N-acetyltransferase
MTPDLPQLYDVIEGTWPPASKVNVDGWTLRDGAGGGKRVSAATQTRPGALIDTAEMVMEAAGEPSLFMIRAGEDDLDARLQARGYDKIDPTNMYLCDIGLLTGRPIPKVTTFAIWEPLAIMEEIWAKGGIGPARLAVMHRAACKTGILGRWNEKPAGVAFAAVHDGVCMVHAVEILPHQRRQGVAGWLMRKAALWGEEQGARHLSVLCTEANAAANQLYNALGLSVVGQYHYRQKREGTR